MPLTEGIRELRKKHIGASEVAAVLGISPWRTAYDVWLEKTGRLDGQEIETSEAADLGNMIENGLLDWAAGKLGVAITKNQYRVHPGGILSATHDALITGAPEGLEAKTAGILNPWAAKDNWGPEGTDEIPDHFIVQAQAQAAVSNLAVVHVAALIGGRGRQLFIVARNNALIDAITERCHAFWDRNVQADTPPDNSLPSVALARLVHREAGKTVTIDGDTLARWKAAKEACKAADAAAEEAEAAVLAAMGDAEIADSEADRVKIIRSTSRWVDAKALAAEAPDVHAKYLREKPYAYPRLVKRPGA